MIHRNWRLGLVAVCVLGWLASSCETTVTSTNLSSQAQAPTRTLLAPGDTLRFTFPGAPELNQTQKIRSDGRVSLPLVGEVEAARRTVGQLQNDLMAMYKSQLKASEVVVSVEGGTATVVVSGAVPKPGRVAFERPTTVFQAIMESGGVTEFGSLRNVRLIRTISGVQQTQIMDLRPIVGGVPTKAFYVRDGDVIYVPQSAF